MGSRELSFWETKVDNRESQSLYSFPGGAELAGWVAKGLSSRREKMEKEGSVTLSDTFMPVQW